MMICLHKTTPDLSWIFKSLSAATATTTYLLDKTYDLDIDFLKGLETLTSQQMQTTIPLYGYGVQGCTNFYCQYIPPLLLLFSIRHLKYDVTSSLNKCEKYRFMHALFLDIFLLYSLYVQSCAYIIPELKGKGHWTVNDSGTQICIVTNTISHSFA